jgi:predicted glycoside hydrolase/deacetylase ChbG (UPF0249 family)
MPKNNVMEGHKVNGGRILDLRAKVRDLIHASGKKPNFLDNHQKVGVYVTLWTLIREVLAILSLRLTKQHSMKAYWSGGIAPLIL